MELLIKKLKNDSIEDITEITDAEYENDPDGTKANAAYFEDHVHIYMKHLAMALQPEKAKIVSNLYEVGDEKLGDPFYTDIDTCYTQVKADTSGISNKASIYICNRATEYGVAQNFDANGYIVFEGDNKHGTVLNVAPPLESIKISNGVHIFRNIKFKSSIEIWSGTAVFENCDQTEGSTMINGTSTVIISQSGQWGNISVLNGLSNVKLWCEDINNMLKTAVGNHSIEIPAELTAPEIVIRRVAAQGDCSDPQDLIREISGFEPFITARPII